MIVWTSASEKPAVESMVLGMFRDGTICTVMWENGDIEVKDSVWECWDELDYIDYDYIDEGWYMVNASEDHPIPFYNVDIIAWAPMTELVK